MPEVSGFAGMKIQKLQDQSLILSQDFARSKSPRHTSLRTGDTPDGKYAYVANGSANDNSVPVIDTASNMVVATIHGGPRLILELPERSHKV
jgi:YVTN family beta-propeller protein